MSEEAPKRGAVPEVEESRALMTTRDREKIAGVETHRDERYRTASRVRARVEEFRRDLEWLDEHHPKLAEEVRGVLDE